MLMTLIRLQRLICDFHVALVCTKQFITKINSFLFHNTNSSKQKQHEGEYSLAAKYFFQLYKQHSKGPAVEMLWGNESPSVRLRACSTIIHSVKQFVPIHSSMHLSAQLTYLFVAGHWLPEEKRKATLRAHERVLGRGLTMTWRGSI